MKKKAGFIFGVLMSIILILILCYCGAIALFGILLGSHNDRVPRSVIYDYVNENHELLEALAHEDIPTEREAKRDFINDYLGSDTIVKSAYPYNDRIVEFSCGSSGLSVGSTYTGFYYSRDDTPFALMFDGKELKEIEPGIFVWRNENGTHEIRTERIRKNWFFYDIVYN